MLIGISGKMGSGKDTVGKILQYLTLDPRIYRMQTETIIMDMQNNWQYARHSEYEIKKFGYKLKQIAALLTGNYAAEFEDEDFKNSVLPEEWWNNDEKMTVRQMLQILGTDALRNNLHINVWVNALFADYKPKKLSQYQPSHWIITDVRFPNEAKAIKERNGILIRVNRDIKRKQPEHTSETALDGWKSWDQVIDNNDSIEKLIEALRLIKNEYAL